MPETPGQLPLLHRTAVVTGASSGVGRAIAMELAANGADVLVHARSRAELAEETAAHVRGLGRESLVLLADFSLPEHHESFCRQAWDWRGGVDIWINNAGVDVLTGGGADDSFFDKLERLWRVDVCATMALSRWVGSA